MWRENPPDISMAGRPSGKLEGILLLIRAGDEATAGAAQAQENMTSNKRKPGAKKPGRSPAAKTSSRKPATKVVAEKAVTRPGAKTAGKPRAATLSEARKRPTAEKNNPSAMAQLGLQVVALTPGVAPVGAAPGGAEAEHAQRIRTAIDELQAGNLEAAGAILDPLLAAQAEDFDTLHAGAVLRLKLGRFAEALELMQKAVTKNPGDAQAQQNLGGMLARQGRLEEAADYFKRAIAIDPRNVSALTNLGLIYQSRGQIEAALGCYRKAIAADPGVAEGHSRLATALKDVGDLPGAIASARRALEQRPNYPEALGNLIHYLQHVCDWRDLPALEDKLDRVTAPALQRGLKTGETPLLSIARSADAMRNLRVAQAASKDLLASMSSLNMHFPHDRRRGPRKKLTVGYLSGDFRNHPVAHLVRGLFQRHDRDCFQVIGYSYGPDDGSAYRQHIASSCDLFVDLRSIGTAAGARRIYEDGVDILVEITGYVAGHRLDIPALRPAPLQVSWLGFPGSTGAAFFDYAIVDPIVLPPSEVATFSERPIWMPHAYQINDSEQPISARTFRRADFHLPENAFVFCCFNNTYKIEPQMFDLWMRLLKAVPGSVLWLLRSNPQAEENLRREAAARGVAAERLLFDGKLPKDQHLARLALADLALDTLIYNGHTTSSDALWAGVPLVGYSGMHFASRVSASLLTNLGLTELIATSLERYEALVLELARDPARLRGIRRLLAERRMCWPLFDTARFVRNLEAAMIGIWNLHQSNKPPAAIVVADKDPLEAVPFAQTLSAS
jgi:predicted O-linked N-acetylglucosamine transferase (SPINDLY family)